MTECPSHATVIRVIGSHDAAYSCVDAEILGEAPLVFAVPMDVLPCGWADDRYLVGRDAYDVAVVCVMKMEKPLRQGSISKVQRDRYFRSCCDAGTSDLAQRVKIDVIQSFDKAVEAEL